MAHLKWNTSERLAPLAVGHEGRAVPGWGLRRLTAECRVPSHTAGPSASHSVPGAAAHLRPSSPCAALPFPRASPRTACHAGALLRAVSIQQMQLCSASPELLLPVLQYRRVRPARCAARSCGASTAPVQATNGGCVSGSPCGSWPENHGAGLPALRRMTGRLAHVSGGSALMYVWPATSGLSCKSTSAG